MSAIDLDGLGDEARAVMGRAEVVARELGAVALGTEHLLLGLLAVDGRAARALSGAGATRAASRHKVVELSSRGSRPADGPLELTSRAARAIGRAHRFSHQDHAEEVGTEHLLLGVLDVEGKAGQVLRGIGVDVGALRGSLVATPADTPPSSSDDPAMPRCPSCAAAVADLAFRVLEAVDAEGRSGEAVVFSCRACGAVLGVSRRGTG